jgi:hypothetical protein
MRHEERKTIDKTYSSGVHRADLKSGRIEGARLIFHLVRCGKRVVSQIDIVLESERDLAVGEESAGSVFVVQPFENRLEGVETAIEGEHHLRSWRLCLSGRHLRFVVYLECEKPTTRPVTRDGRAFVTRLGARPERPVA